MDLSKKLKKEIKLPNHYKLKSGKKTPTMILYDNKGKVVHVYRNGYDLDEVREKAFTDFRKRNIRLIYSSQ